MPSERTALLIPPEKRSRLPIDIPRTGRELLKRLRHGSPSFLSKHREQKMCGSYRRDHCDGAGPPSRVRLGLRTQSGSQRTLAYHFRAATALLRRTSVPPLPYVDVAGTPLLCIERHHVFLCLYEQEAAPHGAAQCMICAWKLNPPGRRKSARREVMTQGVWPESFVPFSKTGIFAVFTVFEFPDWSPA
jgi:hypothetical protein